MQGATASIRRRSPNGKRRTVEQEATIVTFRLHTLCCSNDCPYALQAKNPTHHPVITTSQPSAPWRRTPARCRRRLRSQKKRFKAYLIGFFHIDIVEVQTAEGKLYLVVDIDRSSKSSFVE